MTLMATTANLFVRDAHQGIFFVSPAHHRVVNTQSVATTQELQHIFHTFLCVLCSSLCINYMQKNIYELLIKFVINLNSV